MDFHLLYKKSAVVRFPPVAGRYPLVLGFVPGPREGEKEKVVYIGSLNS